MRAYKPAVIQIALVKAETKQGQAPAVPILDWSLYVHCAYLYQTYGTAGTDTWSEAAQLPDNAIRVLCPRCQGESPRSAALSCVYCEKAGWVAPLNARMACPTCRGIGRVRVDSSGAPHTRDGLPSVPCPSCKSGAYLAAVWSLFRTRMPAGPFLICSDPCPAPNSRESDKTRYRISARGLWLADERTAPLDLHNLVSVYDPPGLDSLPVERDQLTRELCNNLLWMARAAPQGTQHREPPDLSRAHVAQHIDRLLRHIQSQMRTKMRAGAGATSAEGPGSGLPYLLQYLPDDWLVCSTVADDPPQVVLILLHPSGLWAALKREEAVKMTEDTAQGLIRMLQSAADSGVTGIFKGPTVPYSRTRKPGDPRGL